MSGTPQVRRSSVVSVTVTTSTDSAVSSCSTLLRVSPTRTSPTGTVSSNLLPAPPFQGPRISSPANMPHPQVTSSVSARTSPSFSAVTRSMSRSARSRPRPSPSTARRTSSTTTSPPSPTTTSRSPSCGSQESLSATRLLYVFFCSLHDCRVLLTSVPGLRCCPRSCSPRGPGRRGCSQAVPAGDGGCLQHAPPRRGRCRPLSDFAIMESGFAHSIVEFHIF